MNNGQEDSDMSKNDAPPATPPDLETVALQWKHALNKGWNGDYEKHVCMWEGTPYEEHGFIYGLCVDTNVTVPWELVGRAYVKPGVARLTVFCQQTNPGCAPLTFSLFEAVEEVDDDPGRTALQLERMAKQGRRRVARFAEWLQSLTG